MAPRGSRIDLSTMTSRVGRFSPVDGVEVHAALSDATPSDGTFLAGVKLDELVANPRNDRDLGDLTDLSSIAEFQLQPGVAISRKVWLGLFPEDEKAIGTAKYVIANGCRRLAASRLYGRPGMDIVVRDNLAASRLAIAAAVLLENIGRRDYDIIEEARAVERLCEEAGNAAAAAESLQRTRGWISQRRALLKLTPELQDKLRAGELAVRVARSIARVPMTDQVAAWQAAMDKQSEPKPPIVDPKPADEPKSGEPKDEQDDVDEEEKILRTLRKAKADAKSLGAALRNYYGPADRAILIDALS